MTVRFIVQKTVPPPTWMDLTSYEYWKINNSLGGWDPDNERWVAVNENIDLSPVYPWPTDYRPEDIRITHTAGGGASSPDVRLYDTQSNLIASADNVADLQAVPITYQGYDIDRLVLVSNQVTTWRAKPIEFEASYSPYDPSYSIGWSETEKSTDMVVDTNTRIAYKGIGVGNFARTILADTGRSSGKRYFEVAMHGETVALTNSSVGIRLDDTDSGIDYERGIGNAGSTGYGYWAQGRFYINGSLITQDPSNWGVANRWVIIGVAVDFSLGYVWFSRDGVWQSAAGDNPDPATGTDPAGTGVSGVFYPAAALYYQTDTYFSEAYFRGTSEYLTNNIPSGFLPWDQT